MLGIGIDENTAIILKGRWFTVIGSGAVYVFDGRGISHSNVASERINCTMSLTDVRMHVLADGDKFDLSTRRPHCKKKQ